MRVEQDMLDNVDVNINSGNTAPCDVIMSQKRKIGWRGRAGACLNSNMSFNTEANYCNTDRAKGKMLT